MAILFTHGPRGCTADTHARAVRMKTGVGGSRFPESSSERAQVSAHAANRRPGSSMVCGAGRRLLSGAAYLPTYNRGTRPCLQRRSSSSAPQ
eukprot:6206541-Pleurochrysis_carterae.AAC.1